MKRALCLIFAILFLLPALACRPSGNVYEHDRFSLALPEGWARVNVESVVCFAKDGKAAGKSNISFYVTEKNYYFDEFTAADYAAFAPPEAGYTDISNVQLENLRIDSWKAHRVSMQAKIGKDTVTLVLYAIDAEETLFFVLLQGPGESYVAFFDRSMRGIDIK
ncbi:MAG: hypothetical protein FWF10_09035 [Clostridiales bacterium]|nr:hypothetical protein [Clostridiales bacterium]